MSNNSKSGEVEFIGAPFVPEDLKQLQYVFDVEDYKNRRGEPRQNRARNEGPQTYGKPTIKLQSTDEMIQAVREPLRSFIAAERGNVPKPTDIAVRARDGSQTILYETADYVAILSPTPYMAQLHLNVWAKNPNNVHIYNYQDKDIINKIKAGTKKYLNLVGLGNEQVQYGCHFPPTVWRLHVHVLVGKMTDMGWHEENVDRWTPV